MNINNQASQPINEDEELQNLLEVFIEYRQMIDDEDTSSNVLIATKWLLCL